MARRRKGPSNPPIPEWVLTYGDMMSLLLCFFILLAAFSELKKPEEYQRVIDAIKQALGSSGARRSFTISDSLDITTLKPLVTHPDTNDPVESNAQPTDPNIQGRQEKVARIHEGQQFVVGGPLSFAPGSWELSPEAKDFIREQIAPMVRGQNYKVAVRGHAWGLDDRAPGVDPMELSWRRAKAVVDFMVQECGVKELILMPVAVGTAEPMALSRHALEASPENRRVEVYRTEVAVDELHPDPAGTGRTR
ncbi:MAG TPA: flagellar motor protein MotB [Phycisphaerales bacterium]|nr:flagellar motor protein MotB [Phycisphaerales bacterium]